MNREDVFRAVAGVLRPDDITVAWFGGERNQWKTLWHELHPGDATMSSLFMGGLTAFAFGLAVARPNRRVLAMDSDGSLLLGVGILCTLANERPQNLTVLVLDNECYEGTGRQPTHTSGHVDLARLADGAGIPRTATARDTQTLAQTTAEMLEDGELGLVVAKFEPGPPPAYPRDRLVPWDDREGKYRFIRYLEHTEKISIKPIYVDE